MLILWSQPTGAHLIGGTIRSYFENNGFEVKFGYPTSDEQDEPTGKFQTFEQGTLHWASATNTVTWTGK